MGDRTEFRVLGPLQVLIDGQSVRLGGPRPRGLLACCSCTPGSPDVEAARLRLTELRLSTVEDQLDGELARGRHAEILAELVDL
jgi:hypothetical protein